LNFFSYPFPYLKPGAAEFISRLQVQPEFRGCTEKSGQAERSICRNGSLLVENAGDPVGGHMKGRRQLSGRHSQGFYFFPQDFSRVNRSHIVCHDKNSSSVVIDNLHIVGAVFSPFKTKPPLLTDPDAVRAFSISPQCL
jgi:hypothetical protein